MRRWRIEGKPDTTTTKRDTALWDASPPFSLALSNAGLLRWEWAEEITIESERRIFSVLLRNQLRDLYFLIKITG